MLITLPALIRRLKKFEINLTPQAARTDSPDHVTDHGLRVEDVGDHRTKPHNNAKGNLPWCEAFRSQSFHHLILCSPILNHPTTTLRLNRCPVVNHLTVLIFMRDTGCIVTEISCSDCRAQAYLRVRYGKELGLYRNARLLALRVPVARSRLNWWSR